MNWEIIEETGSKAKIKVIGVGGAGGNAVIHMMEHEIQGPDFICANTDSQALDKAKGATILKLGDNLTKGLGAGANPEVGKQAAERDRDAITDMLDGADMVFITAGMGGGTGTGAAPVIA
ncbi:MAG: cell division protein FtsZ, partial [Gammaproteobacteria bacterium]|nr:cell division protein FtsZ [Gammaproteobacteria bacterium]